jgi:hypothetical protein
VKLFEDIDVSAFNGKHRPGFIAMMDRLDQTDALVFWRLDRLSRSTVEAGQIAEQCKAAAVNLVATDMDIDTTTAGGKFIYTVEPRRSRRRERTHNAATIAVVTTHAANPAAAMVHIPCMSYPPFGKRTTVAVTPAAMSPRIAQPTTATPQRSRRSMRWILVGRHPRLPLSRTGNECRFCHEPTLSTATDWSVLPPEL